MLCAMQRARFGVETKANQVSQLHWKVVKPVDSLFIAMFKFELETRKKVKLLKEKNLNFLLRYESKRMITKFLGKRN